MLFLGVGVVCGLGSLGIQILDSEVRNVGVCVVWLRKRSNVKSSQECFS